MAMPFTDYDIDEAAGGHEPCPHSRVAYLEFPQDVDDPDDEVGHCTECGEEVD